MAPSKEDFQTVLAQARKLVQEQLELTEKVIFGVAKNAPAGINERLESLFQRKGKRIRSTLLCLIAQSGSQKPDSQRVAHACAGIELLHLASLVHDDIIDGTDIRRGQKTAHKEWGTQVAVLIGDYVLSQAMQCVIDEESHDIPTVLSKAADKLIEGEILELDQSGNMRLSFGQVRPDGKPLRHRLPDYRRPPGLRFREQEPGQGEVHRPRQRAHHASAVVLLLMRRDIWKKLSKSLRGFRVRSLPKKSFKCFLRWTTGVTDT